MDTKRKQIRIAAAKQPEYSRPSCDIILAKTVASAEPATLKMLHCLAGNVAQWGGYTTGPYRNVAIATGDHYFVSTHYQVGAAPSGHTSATQADAASKTAC